jgi:hypothetical protein
MKSVFNFFGLWIICALCLSIAFYNCGASWGSEPNIQRVWFFIVAPFFGFVFSIASIALKAAIFCYKNNK